MIRGYIHPTELERLKEEARKLKNYSVIVEIGSFLGLSTTTFLLNSVDSIKIYCIDTWDNRDMVYEKVEDTFEEFLLNMTGMTHRVTPIKGDSNIIGKDWSIPIDLLFIDGNHNEEIVYNDICLFVPHIKHGGVLLMHDYTYPCGVKPALEKYVNEHNNIFKDITVLKESSILKANII